MEFASRHVLTAMGVDGAKLLETLPSSQKDGDPAVLAARAAALLRQNKAQEALALCRVLAEKQPNSAQYALYFAITLKRAHEFAEAEKQLRRAIELDPSLQEPYFELASLIGIKGRLRETAEAIDQYLKWNPQSISFRVAKPKDIE
jgi:Flp pilus assembly protein TadD